MRIRGILPFLVLHVMETKGSILILLCTIIMKETHPTSIRNNTALSRVRLMVKAMMITPLPPLPFTRPTVLASCRRKGRDSALGVAAPLNPGKEHGEEERRIMVCSLKLTISKVIYPTYTAGLKVMR